MDLPRYVTDTPRWDLTQQIRRHINPAPSPLHPTEADLMTVYRALCARDRATVYRVALSLAEHAAEVI